MSPPHAGTCAAATTARVMTVGAPFLLLWSVVLLRPAWAHDRPGHASDTSGAGSARAPALSLH